MPLQHKEFEDFCLQVRKAYLQFSVWMYTTNELAKPDQRHLLENELFWQIALPAFQETWIFTLSRVLDNPYRDVKNKSQPHLSLDYISEKLNDSEISDLIQSFKSDNKQTIESITKDQRDFIAHNIINGTRQKQIQPVEKLFNDLEKIILKIGEIIGYDLSENSLFIAPSDYLNSGVKTSDDAARLSVQKLFAAIHDCDTR